VAYIQNDPANGSVITIANLEKLPMPVTVEITEANGKTGRIKLPVEVWQHGSVWKFRYNSTGTVSKVVIDPDKLYPDTNKGNNIWHNDN
jgi:hypothetical protein